MDRLDVKLWALAEKGQIVPDRSLLKTPEQIAEIRKSADLNTQAQPNDLNTSRQFGLTDTIPRLNHVR